MSEVGNKALLRAIADILEIKDVRQFASELSTERIVPTISVGSPIVAPQFRWEDLNNSQDVTGLATYSATIVSCGENEVARVLALEMELTSATPFAVASLLRMQGYYSLEEVGCKVFNFPEIDVGSAAGPWEAKLALGGFQCNLGGAAATQQPASVRWNGLVPPNKSFTVQFDTTTNMPANSTAIVRAIYCIGPAPFQPPT